MSSNCQNCQFWLANNKGQDKMRLPVVPEQITITHDSKNDSVSVAGLGEVTFIQDPTAKTYEWTCWFPAVPHRGSLKKTLKTPQTYVDKIEEWIASRKPVKLTITGTKINCYCSIESWNYYEKGGDPDTLYYTIKLKEYKDVSVRKLDMTPPAPARKPTTTGGGSGGQPANNYKKGKVKTNGSRLMLRKKASTSSAILKKMPNGSALTIKSKSGGWYAVIYKGTHGYAYAKWVKVTS